jgi:hypothetical protein
VVYVTAGVFAMLSLPAVLVDALCIMAASSSMGFYAATLEPNLRQVYNVKMNFYKIKL